MAIGVGIWVFFGWMWLGAGPKRRLETVAAFGVVAAAAFVGGASPWLFTGRLELSSVPALAAAAVALAAVAVFGSTSPRTLIDRLAPAGIAGLSVSRLGCLFEGCDFGRLADRAPAVIYPDSSRAWEIHVAEYGLSPFSSTSLAVHPFAGYLALWGLGCAAVGEWWRRQYRPAGEAAAVTALLFLAGAGAIEWLREPAAAPTIVDGWSVLPAVYWAGAAAVFTGWWWWRRNARRLHR